MPLKNWIYNFTFSIIFLLTAHLHVSGQGILFQNYGSENGLSQNSVYAVAQTKEGFIWIGTQNGLDRFDGYDFSHYKKPEGFKSGLPDNYITTLSTDADDNVWIGTSIGARIYSPRLDRTWLPSEMIGRETLLDHKEIRKIINNIVKKRTWVITKNNGIILYDKASNNVRYFLDNDSIRSSIRDINIDANGNEWCLTETDLYAYKANAIVKVAFDKTKLAKGTILQDILVADKTIWIGSVNGGLFFIHNAVDSPLVLKPFKALPAKEITRLLMDKKGNFWVGTSGEGLFVLYHNSKDFQRYTQEPGNLHSIKTNYILSIFEDKNGILWIGTSGGGVSVYDSKKAEFEKITFHSGNTHTINSNLVLSVSGDDKYFYFGTLAGGFIRTDTSFSHPVFYRQQADNPHSLLHNSVYSIIKDEKGKIWLGTKSGLSCYDPLKTNYEFENFPPDSSGKQKFFYALIQPSNSHYFLAGGYNGLYSFDLLQNKWQPIKDVQQFTAYNTLNIRFMLQLKGDNMLLCTEGNGLWVYDYKRGVFSDCKAVSAIARTIRHACYAYGSLWLGTDNGLIAYDLAKDSVLHIYNSISGLLDNVVYAILPATKNILWISTNTGLAKVNVANKEIHYFDEGYGLQSAEFNTACCFAASNGNFIFGGINGINVFNPVAVAGKGVLTPPIITGIKVMNRPLITDTATAYLTELTLPNDRNFISISFSMPNFSHAEKNRYLYKLEGVDNDWVASGTGHTASYTQLKPGTYYFHLRAINSEGDSIESNHVLTIRITPAWWQTYWFMGGCILVGILLLYTAYRQKIKKIKTAQRIQNKLLEYEINALHAQMNPHFIFNCLAGIRQLVLDNETEQAAIYINRFSILIRKTLEHSQKPFVSIKENNEYLRHYIEMEQLRFGSSFQFHITVSAVVDEDAFKIPPMILQPFIENAIWHGLMPNKGKGSVNLTYEMSDDKKLICVIEDDGVGFNTQTTTPRLHKSYGIESVHKRLQLIKEAYGLKSSVVIINKKEIGEQGTKIILTFEYPESNLAVYE